MFIFLFILIFILLATFAYAGLRGAPWVPTKANDVERFLKLANIQKGQTFVDLGCGDGRLIAAAAQAGANAIGYELSLFPFILAHIRRLFQKDRSRISIKFRDIWNVDLSNADIVYSFLMPKIHDRLKEKIEKELKPKSKVIMYVWPMHGWTPIKKDTQERRFSMYLYEIP